jgi:acyl dehydratase
VLANWPEGGPVTSGDEWMHGKITDEAIAVLRSRIGTPGPMGPESEPYNQWSILRYLASVGDDNPLWWDEKYAAGTRWGGVVAPPRMLKQGSSATPASVTRPIDASRVTFMGEDVLRGVFAMIAGTRIVFERPVRIGDRLHAQSAPYDVLERKSRMAGRSLELVNKTVYYNQNEELVATAYDSVIRMEREAARESRKYLDIPPAQYTAEQMESLYAHYGDEYAQRRGNQPRYWEDTQVGAALITLAKGPLTVADIAAYFIAQGRHFYTGRVKHFQLQANPSTRLVNLETNIEDEWASAHWDEYFARRSGIPRPYDEGPMRYDNLTHLVTDWMGDDAVLREIAVQLRAPVLLGDLSWCTGEVAGKREEGGRKLVDLHIWIMNQRNERTTAGKAVVELPSRP